MGKFISLDRMSPKLKAGVGIASLQGLYYASMAFLCYSNVYLQEMGFSASLIGILVAICSAVGIASAMFWGMLSDKINSIKKVLLIITTSAFILNAVIPFLPAGKAYSVPLFFAYYAGTNFFKGAGPTILDNMAIRTCTKMGVNYGATRSMGSLTYGIISLVAVALVSTYGLGSSFIVSSICGLPFLVILFFSYDPKMDIKTDGKKHQKVSLKPLFKNYYYVTFLIFASIHFLATSGEASFLSYLMAEIGIETTHLGSYLTFKAISEMPILLLALKFRSKMKLKYMIMTASCLMSLECFGFAFFTTDLVSMTICGAIFGIGNGFFLASVAAYLFKLAPDNLKASAQSTYAAVCAVSGIGGNLIGGFLFDAVGARPFYTIIGCTILLAGVTLFVTSKLRPSLPNPGDDMN